MSDFHDWANNKNWEIRERISRGDYPYQWERDVHKPNWKDIKESGLNISHDNLTKLNIDGDPTIDINKYKPTNDRQSILDNFQVPERLRTIRKCKRCNKEYEEFPSLDEDPDNYGLCFFCRHQKEKCRRCWRPTSGITRYYLCDECYSDKSKCRRCDDTLFYFEPLTQDSPLGFLEKDTKNLCKHCYKTTTCSCGKELYVEKPKQFIGERQVFSEYRLDLCWECRSKG